MTEWAKRNLTILKDALKRLNTWLAALILGVLASLVIEKILPAEDWTEYIAAVIGVGLMIIVMIRCVIVLKEENFDFMAIILAFGLLSIYAVLINIIIR